jgi:hypothetical protein
MLADEYFRAKESVPSELRTAEWERVGQWEKERAFYSAAVTEAEILDEFRGWAQKVVEGSTDESTARVQLQLFLDRIGYKPEAGQEGTIKDLRSLRRLTVMLRTNRQLAQGYAQKVRGFSPAAIRLYPAWELVRLGPMPQAPREWQRRFVMAGGKLTADGRMIALKDDKVWSVLGNKDEFPDALGVDYPPFAWQSGMGWMEVKHKEAKKLGLLEGWKVPETKPLASPNESLQTRPRVQSPALREALSEKLQGFAEWDGDVLRFTDPNGTRPMSAEKLADVWKRGIPQEFHRVHPRVGDMPGGNDEGLLQRFALARWVEDHNLFRRDDEKKKLPGRLDVFDDLLRLFQRIEPSKDMPLWRGLSFKNAAAMREFIEELKKTNSYTPYTNKPVESWSVALSGARKYAANQPWRVILHCEQSNAARNISPLVRSIKDQIQSPNPKMPLVTDGEAVFFSNQRFTVTKIETVTKPNEKGGEIYVYVRELL